jgi:hypothetical protein
MWPRGGDDADGAISPNWIDRIPGSPRAVAIQSQVLMFLKFKLVNRYKNAI